MTYIHQYDIFIYVKPVQCTDCLAYEIEPHNGPTEWLGGVPFAVLIGK